jgi:XTP/dITP diphosphohydrolase
MTDLLLASNNPGKLAELQSLLPPDVIVRSLSDVGLEPPEETGATIPENAALKAITAARASGLLTLADDSGLEVEALGGRPGVRSARFAGEEATDTQNNELMLSEMSAVPENHRAAQFVCTLTLANPDGVLASATGRCRGSIGYESRGSNGFGYDPLFVLQDGRTMAELGSSEKNQISHRGKALREILPAVLIAIGAHRFHAQGAGQ